MSFRPARGSPLPGQHSLSFSAQTLLQEVSSPVGWVVVNPSCRAVVAPCREPLGWLEPLGGIAISGNTGLKASGLRYEHGQGRQTPSLPMMGELEPTHQCRGYCPAVRVPGKGTGQEPRALRAGAVAVHMGRGCQGVGGSHAKSSGFTSQKLHCALEVLGTASLSSCVTSGRSS